MHSKKFLAAFLALSMTAAPQASVLASAENTSVQESSENTSEENTGGESDENVAEETGEAETEQESDNTPVNEEFLQITDKKAYAEDDSILIEIISANTAYNRLYIGNRTDEDKSPVIEGTLDEAGRYHYLFYIDPQYLGAKAAYVPGNTADDSWYMDEELYLMLPSEVLEAPVQETADTTETSETAPAAEENTSADNSGEGMISKSLESDSASLWQIGALEEDTSEQDTAAVDDYRIESLEEDSTSDEVVETGADAASLADGTYTADDFSFSGGTGKTKITCEGITVKDGQTYATIKFSSSSFTKLVVDGKEYQPTSNENGSYFEIPVTLNTDMTITGTTIAMTEPHDIDYVIHITKSDADIPDATPTVTPQPTAAPKPTSAPSSEIPKDGTYTGTVTHVSGTATMFKINACELTVKNGKVTAKITLSGTGYDKLFLGTKEEALKADDSKLISYKQDKDGKYTYEFALEGLNKDTKLAARSHRYYEAGDKDKMWYDHTLKFNVDSSNSGTGGDGSKDDNSNGSNSNGGNNSNGSNSGGNNSSSGSNSSNGSSSSGSNSSSGSGSGGSSTGSGGSGSSGGSSSSSKNYTSNTDGKTSQVDSSAGGLKDGEYGSDQFSFSWSGGTGTHGLNITCDKISVEDGQAWAYITFNSGKWIYVKASGNQYDPVDQGDKYSTFKIPIQLNANNKVVGCTTAMSKPYEIEYTLYFGMDIPDSTSGSKSSGGSSVTAKAAGNSTKLADGQEAETDAGTVYKDDTAPKITGLEYMSSLKLEHSKMFKIHYYNNDMTVLEITLNDEFGKDSVDLTQNNAAQTSTDSTGEDSTAKTSSADGEESVATEQDYAKLYKQEVIRYLLVPEDKADQIPAGIDKSIIVVQLPMDKTYVASDVALEMIDKIGADKNVSAVSTTADDCKIDTIKESLEKGNIISAGTYDKADLKELVKNKCKLAIVPSDILTAKAEDSTAEDTEEMDGDSTEDTADATQADENQIAAKYPEMTAFAEKLAILKIPMILDRSKDEKDVLAKYEWSKVYGALFGCEKEVSKLYEAAVSGHSGDAAGNSDTTESTDTTANTETEQ